MCERVGESKLGGVKLALTKTKLSLYIQGLPVCHSSRKACVPWAMSSFTTSSTTSFTISVTKCHSRLPHHRTRDCMDLPLKKRGVCKRVQMEYKERGLMHESSNSARGLSCRRHYISRLSLVSEIWLLHVVRMNLSSRESPPTPRKTSSVES